MNIWHGPFHVAGPLQRPVSTGDALLKIAEVLWKVFLVFLALWVILLAINLVQGPPEFHTEVMDYFAPASTLDAAIPPPVPAR